MTSRRGFLAALAALFVARKLPALPAKETRVRGPLPPPQWAVLNPPERKWFSLIPEDETLKEEIQTLEADFNRRFRFTEQQRKIIEMLSQTNPILDDMPWM